MRRQGEARRHAGQLAGLKKKDLQKMKTAERREEWSKMGESYKKGKRKGEKDFRHANPAG